MSVYIEYPKTKAVDGNYYEDSLYKKCIRTVLCALLFAAPLSAAIPNSPLLKLSLSNDNKKTLVPRMMIDFFYVNFVSSSLAYWFIVEPRVTDTYGKNGFMPYLGPLTAQIPSFACLIGSHLFYPGMWAVYIERTWRNRCREFVRLNSKCLLAFADVHVPGTIGLGLAVGCLLFPFKYTKMRRSNSHKEAEMRSA